MSKKLKIALKKEKTDDGAFRVSYRVIGQSDLMRVMPDFHASNGFGICADECPAIWSKYIYIRGSDWSDDDNVDYLDFDTEADRDNFIVRIKTAVRELNEQYVPPVEVPKLDDGWEVVE